MKARRIYTFGNFRLDATAKVLLRQDEPVRLTKKAIETLLALVENCGLVLTKEELMRTVWPDRVVDEANLAQNVAVIRKALAVEHGEPGSIETFPGRGYRILGPIASAEVLNDGAPEPVSPAGTRRVLRIVLVSSAGLIAVALLLVWALRPAGLASSADEPRRIPVTRQAGKEDQPAISPDGKAVAFVWERAEHAAGIWVQDADRNSPRQVTPEDGIYSSPAWSPDGRRLAYLRFRNSTGKLLVRSLESGGEKEIADIFYTRFSLPNRHLDWSPDGRFLVLDDADGPRQALGVFLVSLETGEKKRLTRPPDDIIGDVDPRFSPDGKTVSFIRAFHRTRDELFTVPRDGGTPVQLTSDRKQITSQDWTSSGKAVVFSSDRSGEFRLWQLDYAPNKAASSPRRLAIYADFALQVALARHAPALVYSVLQQGRNIWRLDLNAKPETPGRWVRVAASSAQDASPQYSPQGDKISFRSDRSGEEQIWVSDSAGRDPVQITYGMLNPSVPRWSPDGRAIVFNNAASQEIFTARLGADGGWSVASLKAAGIHPVFSPDGRWIYAGAPASIVRLPAQGGPAAEVVHIRGISLDISPDGRYIYFVRDPSGTQLWRVEAASGQAEKVLDGLVPYCSSCWALGSAGIYYLGAEDTVPEKQALHFRDLATGRDRTILDYPEPLSPIGSGPFSLSPGGRYLLSVRVDPSNADIFRVEPFR